MPVPQQLQSRVLADVEPRRDLVCGGGNVGGEGPGSDRSLLGGGGAVRKGARFAERAAERMITWVKVYEAQL